MGHVFKVADFNKMTLRFNEPSPAFNRYSKVISACSLKPDLEILPFGDKTEVRQPFTEGILGSQELSFSGVGLGCAVNHYPC